jgi:hypothetical protein
MSSHFDYYYNNVPGKGLCRNNLIYTSLIGNIEKESVFCQWYHNDTKYHQGKNQVVDPALMEEKWHREVKYLSIMTKHYPQHVPEIHTLDHLNKRIYFVIQGPDMWELNGCQGQDYSNVLPDWQDQMLEILAAHRDLGIYKYSLHPSSYFIVDGKLKSINYFFAYHKDEPKINVRSHLSHISEDRRNELIPKMTSMGIDLDTPADFSQFQILALESFSNNYSREFIDRAKKLYV